MPRLGLGLGLGSLIGRPSVGGVLSAPFSPTDLPELELWLDANEGVLNFVGNNFTDETASIVVAAFQIFPSNGVYDVAGAENEKNRYYRQLTGGFNGNSQIYWDGSQWVKRDQETPNEGDPNISFSYATGNTDYPWQATWANGTVTRTATTVDDPAENDETVTQWNNLVSGKPNLSQSSASLQPVFKSNVNGRKAVFFNGDVLSSSGFSTFTQQYSYYLVGTDMGTGTAIRLGNSTIAPRGMFIGSSEGVIGANNGTSRLSTLSKNSGANHNIWSARFNVGNSGEAIVGSKKTHQTLSGSVGTSSANRSDILLGASNSTGTQGAVALNYTEVLIYRAFHDETTANKIIDYLAAKWSITL